MLHRLYIKNIALISEAELEFDKNFNVLSGETGSGKSVIRLILYSGPKLIKR